MTVPQQLAQAGGVPLSHRKQLRNSKIVVWVGIVVSLMGTAMLAWGVMEISSALSSASWPSTSGRIVESNVVAIPGVYGAEKHSAIIRYVYVVGSTEHVG